MYNKWQTLEEFLDNPTPGWCWILFDGIRFVAYFDIHERFKNTEPTIFNRSQYFSNDFITHVMPMVAPEFPL